MTNIDNFKTFVKNNPSLVKYVKNGNMSWQKFYEIYDLYGEDNNIWKEYLNKENIKESRETNTNTGSNTFSNIIEYTKNLDTNKIQEGITSIQKAISLFGDILVKDKTDNNTYTPRPVYRRFDD